MAIIQPGTKKKITPKTKKPEKRSGLVYVNFPLQSTTGGAITPVVRMHADVASVLKLKVATGTKTKTAYDVDATRKYRGGNTSPYRRVLLPPTSSGSNRYHKVRMKKPIKKGKITIRNVFIPAVPGLQFADVYHYFDEGAGKGLAEGIMHRGKFEPIT